MRNFSTVLRLFRIVVSFSVVWMFLSHSALAQGADSPQSDEQWKAFANGGTVRIITKGLGCTCTNVASDMAKVLNEMGKLRVLPVLGHGSLQGIADVLHLKGIDLSIVQSDVLAFIKRNNIHQNIDARLRFVTRLYSSELHLVAGDGIDSIHDLHGKLVNFDVKGRGAAITARNVFAALNIVPEEVHFERDEAIEKVRNGELAASFVVTGKPANSMREIKPGNGLHFLSIPFTDEIAESYVPSILTHEDYPDLISRGDVIETIAVPEVLAVYNWPSDTDRHRKLTGFIAAFFSNFDRFHESVRHPKWNDVNITASVPGWTRFKPAQDWLDAHSEKLANSGNGSGGTGNLTSSYGVNNEDALRERFREFLTTSGYAQQSASDSRRTELMFQDFLKWQQQR